jgi:ribonuclease P protein component
VHTLSKRERLKSTALMDLAFEKGLKIKAFPVLVRVTRAELPHPVPFQAAFSVGKKRFRRAVDRNRIKRLLREAWRVEKTALAKNWEPGAPQWAVVFIFVGNEIPTFADCQLLLRRVCKRLADEVNAASDSARSNPS